MYTLNENQQIPVYPFEPDELIGNPYLRMYNFDGTLPNQSDLLVPHRKEHYLFVFIRKADTRQWIDMKPYRTKNNTFYFTGPNQTIVKEEFNQLWSTGIAFTREFLSLQGDESLYKLPVIQNPQSGHELTMNVNDVDFVEDILGKIDAEYRQVSEWQLRMLTAYTTVLLTYLSRLYMEQYPAKTISAEHILLKNFQTKINECFRQFHEVGDYASLLNISAGHFSEVVKMQSGKPAIKHIHERLVMEARRLLFHTSNPLKEIAYDLGFSDASYFNRFFKRETGVTPAEYRNEIRKMYH
jgi:AraC family transcriptional activator of pobA